MSRLKRAGRQTKRREGTRDERPATCLIITEGTETEVNYFNNIKQIINERFRKREIQENYPIKVEGKARSTSVLVNEAIKRKNRENFSDVWVVFDKDDNTDFNEAIKLAEENGIKVAWSNESFELWLLLHFQTLNSAISRDQYITNLNKHFKSMSINNGCYHKSIKNIFDLTKDYVDIAIKRSEKLRDQNKIDNKNYDKMNPGTNVDILVKELIKFTRNDT